MTLLSLLSYYHSRYIINCIIRLKKYKHIHPSVFQAPIHPSDPIKHPSMTTHSTIGTRAVYSVLLFTIRRQDTSTRFHADRQFDFSGYFWACFKAGLYLCTRPSTHLQPGLQYKPDRLASTIFFLTDRTSTPTTPLPQTSHSPRQPQNTLKKSTRHLTHFPTPLIQPFNR